MSSNVGIEQKPPVESAIIRKISAELEPTHLQVQYYKHKDNLAIKFHITLLLKLSCDSRFQRAFTTCCCVFKEVTLVGRFQRAFTACCCVFEVITLV